MDPILIGFLAIAIVGLLFMNSRARKRQAESTAFRQSLEPGQEVMTASGLFGTVTAVHGDRVTLASAGGAETVWLNAAIAKLVEPEPEDEPDEADSDDVQGEEPADVVPSTTDSPVEQLPEGPASDDDTRRGDTTR
jgi:preprotein translocase subunit YajC